MMAEPSWDQVSPTIKSRDLCVRQVFSVTMMEPWGGGEL